MELDPQTWRENVTTHLQKINNEVEWTQLLVFINLVVTVIILFGAY